ncbi:MAG: hypothetical protein ACRED5_03520, partial [Propylenella sp.]
AFHSVFIGHDGRPDRELVEANDGPDSVRRVVEGGVAAAAANGHRHIAIYAHGGLNNREAGLTRARILGPWFQANGIHPIFVIWQTGFLESAENILRSVLDELLPAPTRVEGFLVDRLKEAKDRAFEVTAREAGVKAIWENMKSRAAEASAGVGAMRLVAGHIRAAFAAMGGSGGGVPDIHLVGHSAGATLLGSFLDALRTEGLKSATTHLWAPACTVSFATATYGAAFAEGIANPKKTYVGVLSDENERSDATVPVAYSKSLLYLVSRALEPDHKTPILGMQKAWKERRPPKNDDIFNQKLFSQLTAWDKVAAGVKLDEIVAPAVPTRSEDGRVDTIDASHGSFDNNIELVNQALSRVLGKKPSEPVTNLKGF